MLFKKYRYTLRALFSTTAVVAICFAIYSAVTRPRSVEDYWQLGQRAHHSEKYQTAVNYYSRALDICDDEQNRIAILANRAGAHNQLQKHENVVDDTSAALRLADPPLGIRGLRRSDHFGNVLYVSDETLILLYLLRANARLELGDVHRASTDIALALELQPNNEHAVHLQTVAIDLADAN